MSPEIDNNIDWTVPSTPSGERVGPSLARPQKAPPAPVTKYTVMDKLLGENNLAAFDPNGTDPYNATGRQIRR
jgi:hypothetical protein